MLANREGLLYNIFMFIRAKEKKNRGSKKIYYTHKLVESVRTEHGPRQRTLLKTVETPCQTN